MRHQTQFTTIAQSAQVSSVINLAGGHNFGLWAPVVDSCQLFLLGSWDAAAVPETFVRLQNPAGSGDWTFAVGPGSKAISLHDVAFPVPFLKVETSVAQTAVRSFAIPVKL
jgi:hypothetical protein